MWYKIAAISFLFSFFCTNLFAQEPIPAKKDSSNFIHILPGNRSLTFEQIDDSTNITTIVENVRLRQGNTLFFADSAVLNRRLNQFEAWGKVKIVDADTATIYANHLKYLGNEQMSYLDGNVKLTDGIATLTTPDLEYNMATNLAIYKKGGKVVNKTTVLTSREGWYYADLKDVYFKKDVVLKDPSYNIVTDSLLYNTETQITRFIAQTKITDSSGRVINTKDGFYNLNNGEAEFGRRPTIIDGDNHLTADKVAFDENSSTSQAIGNVIFRNEKEGFTILSGELYRKNDVNAIMATKKPLLIIKQNNDSTFVTADTLYTAKITELLLQKKFELIALRKEQREQTQLASRRRTGRNSETQENVLTPADINPPDKEDSITTNTTTIIDTIPVLSLKSNDSLLYDSTVVSAFVMPVIPDSINRYFEGYHNVRIYNDSMQAVGDSLFYSFMDSTFRLYKDPVLWANDSQISGDSMLVFTKMNKPEKVEVAQNAFLISTTDGKTFNQVKSSRLDSWFIDGAIDSARAAGFAASIYYLLDSDSAFVGVQEATSDIIDIYFREKELSEIKYRNEVTGTIWPIRMKTPDEMKMEGFSWQEARRPKSRYELFD